MIEEVKLRYRTESGVLVQSPVKLEYKGGRIWFWDAPFALRPEIKAMAGAKWWGFADPPIKAWSVEDCQRNRFQIEYLKLGDKVYEHFDKPIVKHDYTRPLMDHQKELADHFLTYHYGVMAASMRTGKSLVVQEVAERSGVKHWYWIGPLTSLPNMRREFKKWSIDPSLNIEMFNYEALVRIMKEWGDRPIPQGLIVDESSRCKGPTSQRTQAVQELADKIRDKYGLDGYVILMSGTPSPKTPLDWWAQTEIAWPGFLREGSVKSLEQRLAYLTQHSYDAGVFNKRTGWRDDENKCNVCGEYADDHVADHPFEKSKNEVAYLYERLKGLVIIKHLKDCVGLPTKTYRQIICKPSSSLLRAAEAISQAAPNAITVLTRLRELSDGFQYQEIKDGTTTCTHCSGGTVSEWYDPADEERCFKSVDMMDADVVASLQERQVPCPMCNGTQQMPRITRKVKEIPCPKDKALKGLLDECEETGRIVVFAGFTGSVDRVTNLCLKQGWDVVRCDGRGWLVTTKDGAQVLDEEPLDYWANMDHQRVAFVSHPESGGMSLTLRESRMVVFWSNSFKTEYRIQAEARIQSIGEDKPGLLIVDLFHLPTDSKVLSVIRENRKLELLTMGEISAAMEWKDVEGEFEIKESVG
jgi:hypothetical protein